MDQMLRGKRIVIHAFALTLVETERIKKPVKQFIFYFCAVRKDKHNKIYFLRKLEKPLEK